MRQQFQPARRSKSPKGWIKIYQRGGRKYDHAKYLEATQFFLTELMSVRLVNTLQVRLEMRATKLEKGVGGTAATPATGSIASKEHTIVLRRDRMFADNLQALAHECIHVEQKATNRLQKRYWKSDYKLHVRWEGKELGIHDNIPYRDRPWEVEAFRDAPKLVKKYKFRKSGGWSSRNQRWLGPVKGWPQAETFEIQPQRRIYRPEDDRGPIWSKPGTLKQACDTAKEVSYLDNRTTYVVDVERKKLVATYVDGVEVTK